jgi:tripartite-type tricarboxylate transporter receptor subunit TctC
MRKIGKLNTLTVLFSLSLVCCLIPLSKAISAEEKYPTRTIKFVVPLAAGGATDVIFRKLGESVGKSLGQEIIMDNRPGAGGALGASYVAGSKPDGYILGGLLSSTFATTPFFSKMDFNPLTDLIPIAQAFSTCTYITVAGDSPIKTFKDFIEEGRKRQLLIGVTGMVIGDIAMERFGVLAKLNLKLVPFGGAAACVPPLLGGQVDAIEVGGLQEYVRSGKMRYIARITETSAKEYRNVPHVKEFGYDVDSYGFGGIFGPKGLSRDIQARLEDEFVRGLRHPSMIDHIYSVGNEPTIRDSKEFTAYVKQVYERSRDMTKELGLGLFSKGKK